MSETIDPGVSPGVDPHALLRACHTRRLDREGIPMVLALVDEREPGRGRGAQVSAYSRNRSDGTHYADSMRRIEAALAPPEAFRDDDEGALIMVMQVLAVTDLDPTGVMEPTGELREEV